MPKKSTVRQYDECINSDRLIQWIDDLARTGDQSDGGCSRIALSDEDGDARKLLIAWMTEIGLDIRIDHIGNVIGIYHGKTEGSPLVVGSHIDTVKSGGRLDGVLGVLAGLEVLATLVESNEIPTYPIWLVSFTNEEGVRFQPDLMGSAVWSGSLDINEALTATDQSGKTVAEELERLQCVGAFDTTMVSPRAFIELHIEQGPVLDKEEIDIGIVTGVQGLIWLEVIFEGEANHAGTTPMRYRRDPGLAVGKLTVFANELTDSNSDLVANAGNVSFSPGNINVVPATATAWLDFRHPDFKVLTGIISQVREYVEALAKDQQLTVKIRETARVPAVHFDMGIASEIERVANELGLSTRRLVSGAAHDAQMMASIAPSGMIFVPSKDGISHNPREFTSDEQIINGARVLYQVIRATAKLE